MVRIIFFLQEIQLQENLINMQVKLTLQLKFAQINSNRSKFRTESIAYKSKPFFQL